MRSTRRTGIVAFHGSVSRSPAFRHVAAVMPSTERPTKIPLFLAAAGHPMRNSDSAWCVRGTRARGRPDEATILSGKRAAVSSSA